MVPEEHRFLAGVELKGGPVKPASRYRRVPPERDEEPGYPPQRVFPSYNRVERKEVSRSRRPCDQWLWRFSITSRW